MECPLLRSGVAAAAAALRVKPEGSPVKTEAAGDSHASKSEPSPVFRAHIFGLLGQEVLDYLAMFTDPSQMKAADEAPPVHPLDTVMAAFKDDDAAQHTCNKLQTFMEDAFKVHGKELPKADLLTLRVPLDAIIVKAPDDGLPVLEDFLTCVVSFLFTGSRLDREPLDLNYAPQSSDDGAEDGYKPTLSVKKGFTRLFRATEEECILPANTWLVVAQVRSIVASRVRYLIANEALQMSMRFEKLMAEHRFNETVADMTDSDLLAQIIERYNNFKSNVAIRKWQISDDMRRSIEGIILGMTPITRSLIFITAGYNEAILKSKRHQLLEDYTQDLEALLLAKPQAIKVEMTAVWQDNVGRALAQGSVGGASSKEDNVDVDEAEDMGPKPWVLHMKNQIDVGLGVAEQFMQKRLLAISTSQPGQNVATMQRRVLSDAKAKGFDADLERMHNIGFIDLPKLGRLTAPDIAEVSEWCYKVLSSLSALCWRERVCSLGFVVSSGDLLVLHFYHD
eukprot:s127_g10.t1